MGQYKMTLTSFNHYKCETNKVIVVNVCCLFLLVGLMDFSRFFILLSNFNVFGRYPGKVKEPKIT